MPPESCRSETDRPRQPARPWSAERVLARLASQPLNDRTLPPSEVADSAFAHVTNCLAQALPETTARSARIRADLKRAGDYRPLAYQKLAALRLVGMMGSLVVFGTLTLCVSPQSEPWCLAALVLGMFAAWWLPAWRLQRRAARLPEPRPHSSRGPRHSQSRTATDSSSTRPGAGHRLSPDRAGVSGRRPRGSRDPDRSTRSSIVRYAPARVSRNGHTLRLHNNPTADKPRKRPPTHRMAATKT
jgi:hypothetical protein